MPEGTPAPTFVIHYHKGGTSQPLSATAVRELIGRGGLAEQDRISRNGGPPAEFYHYDEFVDLWDVDDSFGFLAPDEPPRAAPPEPTPPPPKPTPFGGERLPELPSPTSAFGDGATGAPSSASGATRRMVGLPMVEDEPDDPPLPFLPASAEPPEFPSEDLDLEDGPPPPPDRTQRLMSPAALADPSPRSQQEDYWLDQALAEGLAEDATNFRGYDPLADTVLDAVTVADLLHESSLYTLLGANPGDTGQQIKNRYLARADLLARRQRKLGRTDRDQVAALDYIRRLIYQTYAILGDDGQRAAYEAAAQRSGSTPSAADYLDVGPPPETGGRPRLSPDELIEQSLDELDRENAEAVGEQSAALGLSDELDAVPVGELALIEKEDPRARAVNFSDEYDAVAQSELVPHETDDQVRTYGHILDEIKQPTIDAAPVGKLFDRRAPTAARLALQQAERRRRTQRTGMSSAARRRVAQRDKANAQFRDGLRWGAEDDPAKGVGQVTVGFGVAFAICLAVVLFTDVGAGEIDYSAPGPWFFGRGSVLIIMALLGTLVIRREPLTSLGLAPRPLHLMIGLGTGAVLGLAGAFVSPIYLEDGASLGLALISMAFIALAHEAFFRGFVTRVLLVSQPTVMGAIFAACLFYGLFYLSYTNVMLQDGFFIFYYSLLLFGFGVGSVLSVLYWRSRSIWPSVVAHTGVLAFSMLLAL